MLDCRDLALQNCDDPSELPRLATREAHELPEASLSVITDSGVSFRLDDGYWRINSSRIEDNDFSGDFPFINAVVRGIDQLDD